MREVIVERMCDRVEYSSFANISNRHLIFLLFDRTAIIEFLLDAKPSMHGENIW